MQPSSSHACMFTGAPTVPTTRTGLLEPETGTGTGPDRNRTGSAPDREPAGEPAEPVVVNRFSPHACMHAPMHVVVKRLLRYRNKNSQSIIHISIINIIKECDSVRLSPHGLCLSRLPPCMGSFIHACIIAPWTPSCELATIKLSDVTVMTAFLQARCANALSRKQIAVFAREEFVRHC